MYCGVLLWLFRGWRWRPNTCVQRSCARRRPEELVMSLDLAVYGRLIIDIFRPVSCPICIRTGLFLHSGFPLCW
jgi:hypothetical protein